MSEVVLLQDEKGYYLRRVAEPVLDWRIDFQSPEYLNLFSGRTRHNDILSRAIGLHKKQDLKVLDLTAGLGKDAFWLAHCGAKVTMLERHPSLALLLSEAVKKTDLDLSLIETEAKAHLETLGQNMFEVAYYDPMFAARTKSALVKKDMQILQALHGDEAPDPSLIPLVLSKIPKLVVKRGKSDPVLFPGVHHQMTTKVTRFDVYLAI